MWSASPETDWKELGELGVYGKEVGVLGRHTICLRGRQSAHYETLSSSVPSVWPWTSAPNSLSLDVLIQRVGNHLGLTRWLSVLREVTVYMEHQSWCLASARYVVAAMSVPGGPRWGPGHLSQPSGWEAGKASLLHVPRITGTNERAS